MFWHDFCRILFVFLHVIFQLSCSCLWKDVFVMLSVTHHNSSNKAVYCCNVVHRSLLRKKGSRQLQDRQSSGTSRGLVLQLAQRINKAGKQKSQVMVNLGRRQTMGDFSRWDGEGKKKRMGTLSVNRDGLNLCDVTSRKGKRRSAIAKPKAFRYQALNMFISAWRFPHGDLTQWWWSACFLVLQSWLQCFCRHQKTDAWIRTRE